MFTVPGSTDLHGEGGVDGCLTALAVLAYQGAVTVGGNGFISPFAGGILFGAATRQRLAEPVQFTETLGNGGLGTAAVMLVVVLAANLLLENFVEPKVMGRTLDIHPLVVLVVTALGGLLRRILD